MATIDNAKFERWATAVVAMLIGAALTQPASAQDSGRLTVDVDECVALEKPEERLACFEARVEAARQRAPAGGRERTEAAPAARPEAAAPAAAPAPSTVRAVEIPGAAREEAQPDRQTRRDEQLAPDIVATVTELRETVPHAYMITLDNGQIWRQSQPQAYPLRIGLEVRLRPSRWGNDWRLTALQHGGQIRVERVR